MNETHNPKLQSWVESANRPEADFPIQNLPFGTFRRRDMGDQPSIGVAIGERILDLRGCARAGLLDSLMPECLRACMADSLNALMALGCVHWSSLRLCISNLLRADAPESQDYRQRTSPLLLGMDEVVMLLPAAIGDYTDFYASINHATNVGNLFRSGAPLLPNYKHVPIGYHGRASSIVSSGTPVQRPHGQTNDVRSEKPGFGPSRALDYELEVGFFVGSGNQRGEPIPIETAQSHIFGVCLLNDWSARDIQVWEYQPLGPFLAKSFATTISPWIITLEALDPFRAHAFERVGGDPQPLPYLTSSIDQQQGSFEVTLEVYLSSHRMRQSGIRPIRVCRGNLRDLYWTLAQMVAHHTSNGCNLRPGDLIGSGTVSGVTRDSLGSMLELTRRGAEPIRLPGGEERKFLEDGDEITMQGYCEREGYARIGFGECSGTIVG